MRTGVISFSLDYGKAPQWLIERMVKLGRIISQAIIIEFGPEEFLKRLADPVWFQSLGSVLAFDWNASGLTTTTMGALKSALRGLESELGVFICGGKGKTSLKTPDEIQGYSGRFGFNFGPRLVFASKAAAKVDSSLIQDGFQIYHHNFIFTKTGQWTVIQQGMNTLWQKARRYHWFGDLLLQDFVEEKHQGGISSQLKLKKVLDLTSEKSSANRRIGLELIKEPKSLFRDFSRLSQSPQLPFSYQNEQIEISRTKDFVKVELLDNEFYSHPVQKESPIGKINFQSPRLQKNFQALTLHQPKTFQEIMMQKGVGPKTIRALSLVAEIIYGAKPSYEDPARYSFAHGGKDSIPYPVDRKTYDKTIEVMQKAISKARDLSFKEKNSALYRLEKAAR